MSGRAQRFEYRLEPLARLRAAQGDTARAAAAQARATVEARRKDCDEAEQRIGEAQQAMREAARQGAPIRPEEQLRLRAYLQRLVAERAARRRELETAEQAQARVLESLRALRQQARTLELHRGRQRGEFEQRRERTSAAQADERWLGARRRSGA
jgi:flagellar biosynthesis chaperone FliJ